MTPEERAKELVDKFYQQAPLEDIEFYSNDVMAKDCALIAVNLLIEEIRSKYWYDVKNEIQKL